MITAKETQMQDKSELLQQRQKTGAISSMYVTVAIYLITKSTKQPSTTSSASVNQHILSRSVLTRNYSKVTPS